MSKVVNLVPRLLLETRETYYELIAENYMWRVRNTLLDNLMNTRLGSWEIREGVIDAAREYVHQGKEII